MFYLGTSHCTTCTHVDLHLTQLSSDLYMNLNNFQHRAPRIPFSKPAIYKSHVFFCGRISGSTNKATHEALQNAPQARCTFLFVLLQVIFSFNEINECYL